MSPFPRSGCAPGLTLAVAVSIALACSPACADPPASQAASVPAEPAAALAVLRRAVTAYDAGDYSVARDLLAPLVSGSPAPHLAIDDTLLWYAAQATDLAGDPAAAAPLFRRVADMRSPLADAARWREADCLHDAGRLDEAASRYAVLVAHHVPGGEIAVALWNEADAAEARHDPAAAVTFLHQLYVEAPAHPLADRAADRARALSGRPLRVSAADRVARATALDTLHEWAQGLAELALVSKGVDAATAVKAELESATLHFHSRDDYKQASDQFLDVWPHLAGAAAADAFFLGARALSRADQDDAAIRLYGEVVRRFPRSPRAAEAQYLSGWLDYNRGRYRESFPALERVLTKYSRSEWADDARFCLGFGHFFLGDLPAALPYFHELGTRRGRMVSAMGRYWEARSLDRLGDHAGAVAAYQALVADAPFNWYALLARARLREAGVSVGPFGEPGSAAGGPPPAARAVPLDPLVVADDAIRRVDELLDVGLERQASIALAAAQGTLLRRYGAVRALPVVFDRYARAGDFHHPENLAEVYDDGALDRPPATADDRALWEAAFPRAYRALVEKYGPSGGDPTDYLYSIMRQESSFNPDELSYADAIGLLQMIPPTSRRVAQRLGLTYTDDVLYDPLGNIELGAWYIGHLVLKFRGQVPLAAGAFNAGPIAMMRWCDAGAGRPLDEFVELVPFQQTRDYIKRVTANYARYLWLYEGKDYQQGLAVDYRYDRSDGIDY